MNYYYSTFYAEESSSEYVKTTAKTETFGLIWMRSESQAQKDIVSSTMSGFRSWVYVKGSRTNLAYLLHLNWICGKFEATRQNLENILIDFDQPFIEKRHISTTKIQYVTLCHYVIIQNQGHPCSSVWLSDFLNISAQTHKQSCSSQEGEKYSQSFSVSGVQRIPLLHNVRKVILSNKQSKSMTIFGKLEPTWYTITNCCVDQNVQKCVVFFFFSLHRNNWKERIVGEYMFKFRNSHILGRALLWNRVQTCHESSSTFH